MNHRFSFPFVLLLLSLLTLSVPSSAAYWSTLFAYNNVTQIALTPSLVYANSDGALFSVDRQSGQIRRYDTQTGLNGSDITCLAYDDATGLLILTYADGKIDLLSADGSVEYVPGLYAKDMFADKSVRNITLFDGVAYLSMDFGIVTFQLRQHGLVDSYYIGAGGASVAVEDVAVTADSVYAFTASLLYKAARSANLSDYRVWTTEPLGRVQRDANKGVAYSDATGVWRAAGSNGVSLTTAVGTSTFKPDGPAQNLPYRMVVSQGRLFVVPGGRWAAQYSRAADVMIFDGSRWSDISQSYIQNKTGHAASDFMDVAVDPKDANHFFVSSYGTGLYEFRGTELIQQYLPQNSSLVTAVESNPTHYTRTAGIDFDASGTLWVSNASEPDAQLHTYSSGQWTPYQLQMANRQSEIATPGSLICSRSRSNSVWLVSCRNPQGIVLHCHKGTASAADDATYFHGDFIDQNDQAVAPTSYYTLMEDDLGNLWAGTSAGVFWIDAKTDFSASNRCHRLTITEPTGEQPLSTAEVYAIAYDSQGQIWVGTTTLGVYVVSSDHQSLVAHYTTANSPMPANYVLSLAYDFQHECMYIGTSKGIVRYSDFNSALSGASSGSDEEDLDYGSMQQWRLHPSFYYANEIALGQTEVYARMGSTLYSVNKQDETMHYWNKTTGLNGSVVSRIAYDDNSRRLVIGYQDGRIDLLSDDGEVQEMSDLYQKSSTMAVTINDIHVGRNRVYLGLPFGIVAINPRKAEVQDTYYIGDSASNVNVQRLCEVGDTLYAAADNTLYFASLSDNLIDYSYWHQRPLPKAQGTVQKLLSAYHSLYVMQGDTLYRWQDQAWALVPTDSLRWASAYNDVLLIHQNKSYERFLRVEADGTRTLLGDDWLQDAVYDPSDGSYWASANNAGIRHISSAGRQYFVPNGPFSDNGYRLKYGGGRMFVAAGGRWAAQYSRNGTFSMYDGNRWSFKYVGEVYDQTGAYPYDVVSIAVDPNDASHFFCATYSCGVLEYRNNTFYKRHGVENSTLTSAVPAYPNLYTRTEGAMFDSEGNFWVLNTSSVPYPVNILTPDGQWHGLKLASGRENITVDTPWEITIDNRNTNYKWIIDQRASAGVILLNDNGTPTQGSDDQCIKRSSFIDGDNIQLTPTNIYCLAQDLDGDIWIGTPTGIIIIPSSVDFFSSNACKRVKIPRNDGTNLADYLLGTEQINAIVVDGANRKWIGTQTSGIYLMSSDGLTTLAHFTTDNSTLLSNTILSIAIDPNSGEVFVGTGSGIASYRSDASSPKEDLTNAYAFPNPVRPNYAGVISIAGLMENTTVNIIDAGGNLVCKTKSNGGIAVWDGCNFRGQRVASGVYTALCNASGAHTTVKILIIR